MAMARSSASAAYVEEEVRHRCRWHELLRRSLFAPSNDPRRPLGHATAEIWGS
jgi:hypothetical protein